MRLVKSTLVENNQQNAALKILLEQKKIAEDIRITIQEDNNILRNKIIRLENELLESEKEIKEMKISSDEIKYLELNPLYEKKCKKTMFNTNLYKVGSPQYKACILSKGKI